MYVLYLAGYGSRPRRRAATPELTAAARARARFREGEMTTDGHLGLSLVDNPVAGGDDMHGLDQGDEQEPLAALPDHLRRVGDLLSTADGASTPLYKALFALLLALPWHLSLIHI